MNNKLDVTSLSIAASQSLLIFFLVFECVDEVAGRNFYYCPLQTSFEYNKIVF